jgi:membrane-bound lytic murein transglycosylase D
LTSARFLSIALAGLMALALFGCAEKLPDSAIGRQANLVAKEGRSGGQKYYRLGPRYEKQLSGMVSQEYAAISGKKDDIPLELNQEVLINLNYFLNDGRGFMTRSLNRGQKYIPIMKAILRQKGLPEDLVYLALIESGFRTEAVSHASAVGPWQFIASTGRRYGLTIDEWVDERMDPIMSTYAAADYLYDLYDMFNSWPLAIAAYNSGEGKIQKGMRKPEVDNYWDMAKADGFLANETKRYVPSFLAAAIISKDPFAYGFEIENAEVDSWDEVVVPEPIDLTMAAQLAGASLERIKELNPHLKRLATPPSELDFVLRVPKGVGESFYQLYAQLPEAQRSRRMTVHLAKRGDTVESVASRYNLTAEVVKQYNNLTADRLRPGQRLVLPASLAQAPGLQEPLRVATSTSRGQSRTVTEAMYNEAHPPVLVKSVTRVETLPTLPAPRPLDRQPTTLPPIPARAVVREKNRTSPNVIASVRHRVRAGDTLGDLARHYGVSTAKLKSDNNLTSDSIREGQVLVVGSNLTVTDSPLPRSKTSWVEETVATPVYHVVKGGETLGIIARKYSTTSDRLKTLNSMKSATIRVGQRLRVGTTVVDKAPANAPALATTYVVRAGDTVSQIAERHSLSSAKLRELNQLKSDQLRPGQELRVAAGSAKTPARATTSASPTTAVYVTQAGDTVSQIAERYDMTSQELRDLNNLTSDRVIVGQKLKVLTAAAITPAALTGPHGRATGSDLYEVVPGDVLSLIAERHNLTTAELRALNGLSDDRIHSGQKLKVAFSQDEAASYPAANEKSPTSATQIAASRPSSSPSNDSYGLYEVVSGDSASVVAERHGLTLAELKALNDLSSDKIRIGQKLKVPLNSKEATPARRATPAKAPTLYEVVPGDSLSVIAARHGLSSAELRALNDLTSDRIRTGQKLKVSPASPASSPTSSPASRPREEAPRANTALYEVAPGDALSLIAQKHGLSSAELRALNDLSSDNLKPGQKLKVSSNNVAPSPLNSASRSTTPAAANKVTIYEVVPGDTLSVIAERHDLTTAELKALNDLSSNTVRSGQKLKVPTQATATSGPRASASPAPPKAQEGDYYVAVAGDSLASVAAFYKLTPAELKRLNNGIGDSLAPGQRLLVKPAAQTRSTSGKLSPGVYEVKPGDTVYGIARAHNLSVDQLKKLNGQATDAIRPGQTLKVK